MAKTYTADHLLRALRESAECNDLLSTLQQLSVDLNQMIHTFVALQQCAPSPSNTGYTAYLESCLLHVRNLITFFHNLEFEKITIRDFVPGERWIDATQAPDLAPVRDVIDQYLVAGNGYWLIDSASQFDQILCSAVVELADAFQSFMDLLPAGSTVKEFMENSTRVALGKLDLSVGGR